MTTFILLLRGINVGKANRLPMAKLRGILVELGYLKPATLLNSGNAVFVAAESAVDTHAARVTAAIRECFGFEIAVTVKSLEALRRIVAGNPFVHTIADPSHFLVVFAQDPGSLSGLTGLELLLTEEEQFSVTSEAAYLGCVRGLLESAAASALLGKAGRTVTTRNWSTTLKLLNLAEHANSD